VKPSLLLCEKKGEGTKWASRGNREVAGGLLFAGICRGKVKVSEKREGDLLSAGRPHLSLV